MKPQLERLQAILKGIKNTLLLRSRAQIQTMQPEVQRLAERLRSNENSLTKIAAYSSIGASVIAFFANKFI